jgi:hypothetical protein
VVVLLDRTEHRGFLNPSKIAVNEDLDLLTPDGEHEQVALRDVRGVYFVRDFSANFESERKVFLSRPKLDGLWVRLKYRDDETIEGVVPNDLLGLLDNGVQITPPDLHGSTLRIFIPRTAIAEMTVLGVVGIARRKSAAAAAAGVSAQPKLFGD